jgi:hypothetical protein
LRTSPPEYEVLFVLKSWFRTATTWVLHALSINPKLQSRLRDELLTLPLSRSCTALGDPAKALSQEELSALNALPLLDAVLRETLRLQAPAPSTFRVATREDEIPLGEPFMGRDGKSYDSIRYFSALMTTFNVVADILWRIVLRKVTSFLSHF